ncbi:MAG: ribbon-helix-helix domain-containing protein [Rhizobiales bacterium]|nr:ribbon-helix-helix domain-containing protein [Hyphomicrobiales bacterium]
MKRSITLSGHRTSISLEAAFWDGLRTIARAEKTTPTDLIARIDDKRLPEDNLSSAIRVYVLHYYQSLATKTERAGDRAP